MLRTAAVCDRSLMQRHHRLTGNARISEIHQNGRSIANRLLVLRVSANEMDRSRFCFVASKRVGNAVSRNRLKRRLREVVRLAGCEPGWDAILIARRGSGDAEYGKLERAAHDLLRRTRLIGAEPQQ